MDRIGLVTLFRDNYGSELQCFATKSYIEHAGYRCDVLYHDMRGWERLEVWKGNRKRDIAAAIRYKNYINSMFELRNAAKISKYQITQKSQRELDFFSDTMLQPKGYEFEMLKREDIQSQYKYFIVGSDQVWNGATMVDPFQFLEFSPDNKKIALSVSFGTNHLKDYNTEAFKKSIDRIANLSAREYTAVDIINSLTGRNIPRLADPVTLLTREEWSLFAEKASDDRPERYIFVHFLDRPNSVAIDTIRTLEKVLRLPVICFAYPHEELESIPSLKFVDGSPYDYVSLIESSSYVCTDSFHTTEFSITFNKPFLVFNRNYQHGNDQGSRFDTLLSTYACKERLIVKPVNRISELPLDKPSFDVVRKSERQALIGYLDQFLPASYVSPDSLKSVDECVGCMACASVCPTKAIDIKFSEFGFRIPSVNEESCIGCGMCRIVCHRTVVSQGRIDNRAYISYSKDEQLRNRAASGGTFAVIADEFLLNGGVVVGAALHFKRGMPTAVHETVSDSSKLFILLGSKYVESNCMAAYGKVAEFLHAGIRVLFSGTSCQVHAMLRYLTVKNIPVSDLYTIDLICHGVPGAKLFADYTSWLTEKLGRDNEEMAAFSFRRKSLGNIEYMETVLFSSGSANREETIPFTKSCYYRMFLAGESYRDACYHCNYATVDKPADITLGDYFEARDDYPELFTKNAPLGNASYLNCIIVHSKKGQELLSTSRHRLFIQEVGVQEVQMSHFQLKLPSSFSRVRFAAIEAYEAGGINKIVNMYRIDDAKILPLRGTHKILGLLHRIHH